MRVGMWRGIAVLPLSLKRYLLTWRVSPVPFYDALSVLVSWGLHCWPVGSESCWIIFLQLMVWLTLQAHPEQQQYGSSRNLSKATESPSCCKHFSLIFPFILFLLPLWGARDLELQGVGSGVSLNGSLHCFLGNNIIFTLILRSFPGCED